MPFVDFAQLKQRVTIEQVAQMLGLPVKKSGSQLRAPCPACQAGGDRAIVITPEKSLFYCFSAKKGGDLIKLFAHVKNCGDNEAAVAINGHFGGNVGTVPPPERKSTTVPHPCRPELRPLEYLQADHEAVKALGLSVDAVRAFAGGYAPKGIMRGRVAFPVHSKDGTLLAYVGVATTAELSPKFLLPSTFNPRGVIFGADKVKSGQPVSLVRDPVEVLKASEAGAENVVCFLCDIGPQELETLAALMDEKKSESVELY